MDKKYIIEFHLTNGEIRFHSTLKSDFCPTTCLEYATLFDSVKAATLTADEIMNNPTQGRDFEDYTIYEYIE